MTEETHQKVDGEELDVPQYNMKIWAKRDKMYLLKILLLKMDFENKWILVNIL